jgi:hypothetical protein
MSTTGISYSMATLFKDARKTTHTCSFISKTSIFHSMAAQLKEAKQTTKTR